MVALLQPTNCGTVSEFIDIRQDAIRNDEDAAEFAKELDAMLTQLVCDPDNGFSRRAVRELPELLLAADTWLIAVKLWIDRLNDRELAVLSNAIVTWEDA